MLRLGDAPCHVRVLFVVLIHLARLSATYAVSSAQQHFDRACEMYLEDGTPDTAIMCLDKAAKLLESACPDWSVSSYKKAADICSSEDESHIHSAADVTGKATRLLVCMS